MIFSKVLSLAHITFPVCRALTADHSGTIDDKEPLANAIKSDSAVIGGNKKHE